MLGRKMIYVRCINCSYNNVAKGICLHDKKAFFVYRKNFMQVRAFERYIPLKSVLWLIKWTPLSYCDQRIRIYHEFEGEIEKSVPRITVWHHEACRVMTNGDPEGWIFLSYPHTKNGFVFLLTTVFYFKKSFQKSLNTQGCNFTWWRHLTTMCMSSNTTNVCSPHMPAWVR